MTEKYTKRYNDFFKERGQKMIFFKLNNKIYFNLIIITMAFKNFLNEKF